MNPFSFIFYDIKRLFGHGKTAFLAMFSPVIVLLLFATFLAPMLSTEQVTKISCAFLNEDENPSFRSMMDMVVSAEVSEGAGVIYPVKEVSVGKSLVEDGKVSAFFYIPPKMYENVMNGTGRNMDFYYSGAHSFEALIFYSILDSSLSVFGQGIRMVYVAAEIAQAHNVSEEQVYKLWSEGSQQMFQLYLNRGKIIGSSGFFNPGGDYPLRFAMAMLFAICSYCVSFPIIYLTNLDVSELLQKRNLPGKKLAGYYFSRLASGTVLILCTFFIMYPVARVIRRIPVRFALSVLPAILLTAFLFSALGILLGCLFKKGQNSLWAGLYVGFVFVLSALFLSKSPGLPGPLAFLIRISPFRACVSIFSNAMFQQATQRYGLDLLILLISFLVVTGAGFAAYMKRGSRG